MEGMQEARYDVVIVGGAFSGASLAALLRRWRPERRVLVVERSEAFDRKVGEATVEISSFFLHRVLGLHDLLAREHLPKHGLRYWFHADRRDELPEMTEVGPAEVPRLPAFQLDRAKLDESLLALARKEGAHVIRPGRIVDFDLGWPETSVEIETGDGERRRVVTRWLLDASGRHALLARKLRLRKRVEEHPTAAAWGRWSGVADLDGPSVLGKDPRKPRVPAIAPARRLATNHFCGYGYWVWAIPLADGDTSVGVVYDKSLFELPAGDSLEARYRSFLETAPGIRELLAKAQLREGDFHAYSHLPYTTSRYMDRGWALVGDAASFLDPYYSPGLDHASISTYATAKIVSGDLGGSLDESALDTAIETHNDQFLRSYPKWLAGIYLGKYELMGDAELTGASFLMDTALYYLGIVTPVHQDIDNLRIPVYGERIPPTRIAYRLMRFYNRRLVFLARHRRRTGVYGRRNRGERILRPAAGLGPAGAWPMLRAGLALWLKAELRRWWPGRREREVREVENPAPRETATVA